MNSRFDGYCNTTVGVSRFSAMYSNEYWMFTVRGLKMPWARVTCRYNNSYPTDGASPALARTLSVSDQGRRTLSRKL